MAKAPEKKVTEVFLMPEGRLINSSLFVRDIYKDAESGADGKPMYKTETTYDVDQIEGIGTIEDKVIDYACEKWGDRAEELYLKGKILPPWIDGEDVAERREDKGKVGDAYKGKLVLRASSLFNKDGDEEAGGQAVYDENNEEILMVNSKAIYSGCYGIVAVSLRAYVSAAGQKRVKMFLQGFQKTADGERFSTPKDHSNLFKPVGKAATGRKRRAG